MLDEAALRAKFQAFDADGKGYIDQTKFIALVRKLGLRMTETKASKAFVALDANDDGRVEFADFSVWWLKYDRP